MIYAFVICQFFVVLFIAVHDWVPLGRLNNLAGIRAADSSSKLAVVTALSTLPFAIALVASIHYANSSFPMWLMWLLWGSYGVALYGVLRTWWVLFAKDPARVARYQVRFANTHTFLPFRNGIRPDTLHTGFHVVLLATVVLLCVLSLRGYAHAM